MSKLNDKLVALVTGGSKGLGKEISNILIENGYSVYSVSRSAESFGQVNGLKADISDEKACRNVVGKIVKTEGRLDLLVNNAGLNNEDSILDTFGVNVFGPYFLIKSSMKFLIKTSGKVINITSLNGLVPTPYAPFYSASKHAFEALGISLSYEAAFEGVSITNLAPGAIYNPSAPKLSHITLRDKFPILRLMFPMVTYHKISKGVLYIAKTKKPPMRIVMGFDAKASFFLSRTFQNIWFFLMDKLYSR